MDRRAPRAWPSWRSMPRQRSPRRTTDAYHQDRNRMPHPAKLLAVATAVPLHRFAQPDIAAAARQVFAGRYPDFDRLARVFASSGITHRYAVRPIEWYFEPRGWPERSAAYVDG